MKTIINIVAFALALFVWSLFVPLWKALLAISFFVTIALVMRRVGDKPDDGLAWSLIGAFVVGFVLVGTMIGWVTWLKVLVVLVPLRIATSYARRMAA